MTGMPTGTLIKHPRCTIVGEEGFQSCKDILITLQRTVSEHGENFCTSGQIHSIELSFHDSNTDGNNIDVLLAHALGSNPNPTHIDNLACFINVTQKMHFHAESESKATFESKDNHLQRWGTELFGPDHVACNLASREAESAVWYQAEAHVLSDLLSDLRERLHLEKEKYTEKARQMITGPVHGCLDNINLRKAYTNFGYAFKAATMALEAEWDSLMGIHINIHEALDADDEDSASDITDDEF